MDTWQFYQNEKGEWCWKHVAATGFTLESDDCFDSRTDCIADAMRHGYLARSVTTRAGAHPYAWSGKPAVGGS